MRECCPYREARFQGRLWTPYILLPGIFVDSTSPRNVFSASGFTSIANLGSGFSSFDRGSISYSSNLWVPKANRYAINKTDAAAFGYQSSASYSLQPSSGFSAYFFGLTASSNYQQNLSQFSHAVSVLLAANHVHTFQIGLFDGTWRARPASTRTTLDDQRIIMAQRKTSATATSFIDTYLSDYRTASVRTSITCGNFTASDSTVGLLGHANTSPEAKSKCFFVLHFQRYLSNREDDLVLGWGAWACSMQDLLPASHPFKNRPPLIGD